MAAQLDTDIRIGFTPTDYADKREIKLTPMSGRASESRRRYIFLVHGFNVRMWKAEEGFKKFRKITEGIDKEFSKDMLTISWPGKTKYKEAVWYSREEVASKLSDFLISLTGPKYKGCHIILIGHSLGARLILETIRRLSKNSNFWKDKRMDIFLMAAAVPVELVEKNRRLEPGIHYTRNRVVFYSWGDLVLKFLFPSGQNLAAKRYKEEGQFPRAVGMTGGPRKIWTYSQRCLYGHRDYWESEEIIRDILHILGLSKERKLRSRYLSNRTYGGPFSIGRI